MLLLKSKKEEHVVVDPDTEAYQACLTVADYRNYLDDFGRNALHYNDAKAFVDQYVADSTVKAQQTAALAQAQQQAEVESHAQDEANEKEEAAYKKCTTIAGCNNYLKNYSQGKYVNEVKAKKAELENEEKAEDEAFDNCLSIAACKQYLKQYPKGKYAQRIKDRISTLELSASTEDKYARAFVFFSPSKNAHSKEGIRRIVNTALNTDAYVKIEGNPIDPSKLSQITYYENLYENRCVALKKSLMKYGMPENRIIMTPVLGGGKIFDDDDLFAISLDYNL